MYKDLPKLYKKVSKLKDPMRSVIASHIWWKICNKHKKEAAKFKRFIVYGSQIEAEDTYKYLVRFGYTAKYATRAVNSTRSWDKVKAVGKAK